MTRQLILDTETTGFEAKLGHRMIEFAALEMIDRELTGNSLHLYINPERDIPLEATNVHGITIEQVADKPPFRDVVDQIIEFIQGAELIIHNAKFDISFMDHHFLELGRKSTANYVSGVIDSLALARNKFPGAKNSLDALCDRFNVDRSSRTYHGALIDCALLAEVYIQLTREQISLLGEEAQQAKTAQANFKRFDEKKYSLLKPTPNQQEVELHQNYLRQLDQLSKGNCLWFNHNQQTQSNS